MSKNLVIVESPAKAKTIQKYLGKDFEVKSRFGHIRDLPKKGMGIDLKTFTPDYEVSADKKKLVTKRFPLFSPLLSVQLPISFYQQKLRNLA